MSEPVMANYEDVQCGRCGSSMDWQDCSDCGGDGAHNFHEVDPLWYDDAFDQPCVTCGTKGGWWLCLSGWEWCDAHPRPGKEAVPPLNTPEFYIRPAPPR